MSPTITIDMRKTANGYSLPRSEHHFDRSAICKRAHQIKAERRQKLAERVYAAEARVVAGKPWHPRTFAQVLKATPCDFSDAMKSAWAEAKSTQNRKARRASKSAALAIVGSHIRGLDVAKLLSSVAAIAAAAVRWADRHFIPERQAGASLPILTHHRH